MMKITEQIRANYDPDYDDERVGQIVTDSTSNLIGWFDGNLSALSLGASLGADDVQACDDRWPLFEDGDRVGTLLENANGLTFKAVDDEGNDIL